MFGLATYEAGLTSEERRWRRERRSAWLRVLAFWVLVFNLQAGSHGESILVHAHVVVGYGLATLLALGLALARRGPASMAVVFVIIDALLVVALFHEHLFAANNTFDHTLTAPSLAVGFLLLTHVALRLKSWLVLVFSCLVVFGWLALLALTVVVHAHDAPTVNHGWSIFAIEGALAAAFIFAAFVCYLLIEDHSALLKGAVTSERRRQNLARFFSPKVVAELQSKGTALNLAHRRTVVMFVDLRSFTRLSETVEPEDVADLLSEYRQLVTEAVFAHGGTVDKFIGDGVMAVFGHPQAAPDDAARAVACSLVMAAALAQWKQSRQRNGEPATDAGIGLHVGPVIGGVLESGSHAEFTVFGDAVNVAERLEGLSRELDACLVVSEDVFQEAPAFRAKAKWTWREAVALDGRIRTLRVAYLARGDVAMPTQ